MARLPADSRSIRGRATAADPLPQVVDGAWMAGSETTAHGDQTREEAR